jgi:hypothetical protein
MWCTEELRWGLWGIWFCVLMLMATAQKDGTNCTFLSRDCSGASHIDFDSVPYMEGIVLSSVLDIMNIFDTNTIRHCLKDRYVVFLGDSTISERVVDMAATLGDLYKDKARFKTLIMGDEEGNKWVHNRHPTPRNGNDTSYYYFNDVALAFNHWNHRNISVTLASERMRLQYRYIGHSSVYGNYIGISTLELIQNELENMLGYKIIRASPMGNNNCSVRYDGVPGSIVIQSGYHDSLNPTHTLEKFKRTIVRFAVISLALNHRAGLAIPTIFWQAAPLHESKREGISVDKLLDMEEVAWRLSQVLPNFVYINSTRVYEFVPTLLPNYTRFTKDFVHFGAVSQHEDPSRLGTISLLLSNYILTHICSFVSYVGDVRQRIPLFPMPEPLPVKMRVLSIDRVAYFHNYWLKFVGCISVLSSNGQLRPGLQCLVAGRLFDPPTEEQRKEYGALRDQPDVILAEELLPLFTNITIPADSSPKFNNSVIGREYATNEFYWVINGEKRLITNSKVFFKKGWDFSDVRQVDADIFDLFLTGQPCTPTKC